MLCDTTEYISPLLFESLSLKLTLIYSIFEFNFQITQLSDRFPSVRIAALCCLIDCTRAVTAVPLSDANIFPEYILPNLMPLCHDRNDLVRAAFACNISVVRVL
jgi:hypothetical protein